MVEASNAEGCLGNLTTQLALMDGNALEAPKRVLQEPTHRRRKKYQGVKRNSGRMRSWLE